MTLPIELPVYGTSLHREFYGSPSSFIRASECPLRELITGELPSLPTPPWNVHGTVIHELIEYPLADGETMDEAYDRRLRKHIEDAQDARAAGDRKSWLPDFSETGRVPFLDIHNFASRREQGLALAARYQSQKTVDTARLGSSGLGDGALTLGPERPIVDLETGIKGKIDLLERGEDGLVIVDFKTGELQEEGADDLEVKPEYEQQLLIYAAMIFRNHKEWPVKWRLESQSGQTIEKAIAPADALKAFEALVKLKRETDSKLKEQDFEGLARGITNGACRKCQWRHRCPASRKQLATEGWVSFSTPSVKNSLVDIQGKVVGVGTGHAAWLDVQLVNGATVRVHRLQIAAQFKDRSPIPTVGDLVALFSTRTTIAEPVDGATPQAPSRVECDKTSYCLLLENSATQSGRSHA